MSDAPRRLAPSSKQLLEELLRETDPERIRLLRKELQKAYDREHGFLDGDSQSKVTGA